MAEEPKPQSNPEPAPSTASSPAPTDVAESAKGAPPPPDPSSKVQAEPLADGTVPTVLRPGETHRSIVKGKTGISSIYHKADVMTTLLTFLGAAVAGGLIIGGYAYFTNVKSKTPTATPKVTKLDSSDLNKLNAFFNGNSAGKSAEVLTVNSSTLFSGRVAMGSDLKVVGAMEVSGASSLGDLSVSKTATLGVTNVRGQLSVNGPLTVQNSAIFNAGATFNGNLATSGNGSFTGTLSAGTLNVHDLSVGGTLNLNGHINIGGSNPSVSTAGSVTSNPSISGTDASGTVTITVKPIPVVMSLGSDLVTVTFKSSYPRAPNVVISPVGRPAAVLMPYVTATGDSFTIGAATLAQNNNATSYTFNYWVAQ